MWLHNHTKPWGEIPGAFSIINFKLQDNLPKENTMLGIEITITLEEKCKICGKHTELLNTGMCQECYEKSYKPITTYEEKCDVD